MGEESVPVHIQPVCVDWMVVGGFERQLNRKYSLIQVIQPNISSPCTWFSSSSSGYGTYHHRLGYMLMNCCSFFFLKNEAMWQTQNIFSRWHAAHSRRRSSSFKKNIVDDRRWKRLWFDPTRVEWENRFYNHAWLKFGEIFFLSQFANHIFNVFFPVN